MILETSLTYSKKCYYSPFDGFMQLTEQLRNKFLDEEGLLRVPGNKQKISTMQKTIESQWKSHGIDPKGVETVMNILDKSGPHEVACLLKLFLRQLPESLFTQDCLELFAQVGGECGSMVCKHTSK